MKRFLMVLVVACGLGSLSQRVMAEENGPRAKHNASFTISPFHLLLPVVEVTAERGWSDKFGTAAIGGFGKVGDALAYELGFQIRWYLVGSFDHGMQVGVEAMHLGAKASGESTSATATGVSFGPFVGYKIATDVGFTFDGQVGYQYLLVGSEARDAASGQSASGILRGESLLLNLNVGWSFDLDL